MGKEGLAARGARPGGARGEGAAASGRVGSAPCGGRCSVGRAAWRPGRRPAGARRRHGERWGLRRGGIAAAGGHRNSWRRAFRGAEHEAARERGLLAARTAGEIETGRAVEQRHPVRRRGRDKRRACGRASCEQPVRERQRGRDLLWRKQSAMANLHEARGEHVQEEAAEELLRMHRDRPSVFGPPRHGVRRAMATSH
jgi:hypothetical protein